MNVTIIGGGNVGGAIAFSLIYSPEIKDICITDKDKEKERALVMDLEDAAWITGKHVTSIKPEYSDYTIITAGKNQIPGQQRKELYDTNYPVIDSIVKRLSKRDGKVIIVTNPVQAITEAISRKYSELEYIKLNTEIDTVRLHLLTGGVGEVSGSHDDCQRVIINGKESKHISAAIRNKAEKIISGKGFTCYGIAAVVRRIIEDNETGKQTRNNEYHV